MPVAELTQRSCPYCLSAMRTHFGVRGSATFVRCLSCASIFMDVTPTEFDALHARAFSDEDFVQDVASQRASVPDYGTWDEFAAMLADGPLLEIGPGSGHLLAAARARGRRVSCVESSHVHRQFIKRTWGIDDVFASLEQLPPGGRFGSIILFNTIEHVYDVHGLVTQLRERLDSGGTILMSTANAGCLIVPVVGPYWSMFKQFDHVSLPSAMGFRRMAEVTGMLAERVWTTELPLETPIGLAVAARDFVEERFLKRGPAVASSGSTGASTPVTAPVGRRIARSAMRIAQSFDPTRHMAARFGVAASVKGLFRRPN